MSNDVPVTTVPSGFGRYSSVSYPGGGWAFGSLPQADSDPSAALLKSSPGGTVVRAGLWSLKGSNNVLVTSATDVQIYRSSGGAALDQAFKEAQGKKGCVFTVAPTALPVFGLPYGRTFPTQIDPSSDVTIRRGFDYDIYRIPMDVTKFGQTPVVGHLEAHSVDRLGRQRCSINAKGNHVVPGEAGYDWPMPGGKPLLSVAAGIVRGARFRDVSKPTKQGEVYIEHQIGTGPYAEGFVSYYAHLSKIGVAVGAKVTQGQKIGEAGTTGVSTENHLHFGVFRLSNLSGHRSYKFETTPGGYGINGIHGAIDPFGWAAPLHIDPWAWQFLGKQDDPYMGVIMDPGAFSIDLWMSAKPPSKW